MKITSSEKNYLLKLLNKYYDNHIKGIKCRKELLAVLVLLDRSIVDDSKTAPKGQLSYVENSKECGIINDSKGNPNHDPKTGQFTDGGSASKTTGNVPTPTRFKTVSGVMEITSDLEVKASKSGKVKAFIRKGGKITNISSFAGEGSNENLVMSGSLAKAHKGTKPEEWSHKTGDSEVEIDGKTYPAEIHWFEHDKVGQVSFKLKKRKK